MSWGHWSGDYDPLRRSILELATCPACLRLRISPVHLVLRMLGLCNGRDMSPG